MLAIEEVEDSGQIEKIAEEIQPGLREQDAMLAQLAVKLTLELVISDRLIALAQGDDPLNLLLLVINLLDCHDNVE